MSALPPKADILVVNVNVCLVPQANVAPRNVEQANRDSLIDFIVGVEREQ
jgi:hypothetical protein